jgi:hypothetical protein
VKIRSAILDLLGAERQTDMAKLTGALLQPLLANAPTDSNTVATTSLVPSNEYETLPGADGDVLPLLRSGSNHGQNTVYHDRLLVVFVNRSRKILG